MKKSNGLSNIATAMIAGAVAGAALGILYAPVKGKKLRKKINRFTQYIKTTLLRYPTPEEKFISDLKSEIGSWEQPHQVND
ncbi:MAG: YtxH domain-containing protein [Bacteroidales bacterium]|nr:YtxH domain-containing protein [Bacteroidales bacterium]